MNFCPTLGDLWICLKNKTFVVSLTPLCFVVRVIIYYSIAGSTQ